MIIQLRGTSGSGKSTAMRETMKRIEKDTGRPFSPQFRVGRKKPLLYSHSPSYVCVLGHYESPCGGCDTIGSARAVYDLIHEVREGNGGVPILCEGLLLSEDAKWTKTLKEEGEDVRVLFLVTSLEECLRRIKGRRESVGNAKELNPSNTSNRIGVIDRARRKLEEAEIVTRRCSSGQASSIVLRWLTTIA